MDASRFPATIDGQMTEGRMTFELVAIDLGKRSFHVHGVSSDGNVLSQKVNRARLFTTILELAPASVGINSRWFPVRESRFFGVIVIAPEISGCGPRVAQQTIGPWRHGQTIP